MSITLAQGRQSRNHLLAKLTNEQFRPLLPLFDLVEKKVKDVLVRQGNPIEYVYFPSTGAYSCIVYMEDGSGVEVATVGNEGFANVEMLLAAMLGVHRPSVSVVAGLFQQAGIIRYTRGHMKILDRAKLEESACECYGMVRGQFERLLGVPRG